MTREEKLKKYLPGPWIDEPDHVEWWSEHGLPCLILRNRIGTLCGYVGVPAGHPWHGKGYAGEVEEAVSVHGGVTFAGEIQKSLKHGDLEDNAWYIGFDCAHSGDVMPELRALRRTHPEFAQFAHLHTGEVYRDIEYVRAEVESLAKQVREAGRK